MKEQYLRTEKWIDKQSLIVSYTINNNEVRNCFYDIEIRNAFVSFSISLDPEEDVQDADLFSMLGIFLDNDLDLVEREQVFTKTIPRIVEQAKALKSTKPPQGLHFSLQQQGTARFNILQSNCSHVKQYLTIQLFLTISQIGTCMINIHTSILMKIFLRILYNFSEFLYNLKIFRNFYIIL